MRKLMTIGELAYLFDIKTTKIRFYERKGLLHPKRLEDSDYRLYSFDDLCRLEVILLFRQMDVPLERIKELLKGYQTTDYKNLLLELKSDIRRQMKQLRNQVKVLDDRLNHLEDFSHNKIRVVKRPIRTYSIIEEKIDNETTERDLFDNHSKYNLKLSNYNDEYVFILNDDFTMTKAVNCHNKNQITKSKTVTLSEGTYVEIKQNANFFNDIKTRAENIIHQIEQQGYIIDGPIIAIEDFRYFLYSNQSEYYTYELKIKETKEH